MHIYNVSIHKTSNGHNNQQLASRIGSSYTSYKATSLRPISPHPHGMLHNTSYISTSASIYIYIYEWSYSDIDQKKITMHILKLKN